MIVFDIWGDFPPGMLCIFCSLCTLLRVLSTDKVHVLRKVTCVYVDFDICFVFFYNQFLPVLTHYKNIGIV